MIYLDLFWTFLKIGALTFGGGYAMLPFIQDEVHAHAWLTDEQLINFIAISESTPGPFAANMSTYVGMETAGILGALTAMLGLILPSFIIILLIASIVAKFKENIIIRGCLSGLNPGAIGMIGAAVITTGYSIFFPSGFSLGTFTTIEFIASIIIFGATLYMALKKMHPITIILLSAIAGIAVGYIFKL